MAATKKTTTKKTKPLTDEQREKDLDSRFGNRWWMLRSSHGRKPVFSKPLDLWESACEYFAYVEDNPLIETELIKFQGEATTAELPKMRAMTIQGLCLYLDINLQTYYNYKEREGFLEVITRIEQVIYYQKFTGAAAELLNPNIIARDLGLADKKDLGSSDGSMAFDGMNADQRVNRIKQLMERNKSALEANENADS